MSLIPVALLLAAYAVFVLRRMRRYLHIFQQEEYDGRNFMRWLFLSKAYDRRLSALILIVAAVLWGLDGGLPVWSRQLVFAALFFGFSYLESDPRKVAKKKLVMTNRAKRIFWIALVLAFGLFAAVWKSGMDAAWVLAVQLIPALLVIASNLLRPHEALIQRKIVNEASARLAEINPEIVGITGSFGKTSVKHILGHILEVNVPTRFTPGSVNTLMGISRVIRENLSPGTHFFLVEMGAYGRGSIATLCRLTPPHYGIITALGEAHYERFKTLDAVAHAKFELAEAVLATPAGKVVVHEDVLKQDYARSFVEKNRDRFLICGRRPGADLEIGETQQTPSGVTVMVRWKGESYKLSAPIFGAAHAGNIALSFAAATMCGIAPDRIVAALRTTPQIAHRLEIKPRPDGSIYIDDAYNSNPEGFIVALDLLNLLGTEKRGRRILVTPGILELGPMHDDIHRGLGEKAAEKADVVIVVRADKIASFVEGFKKRAPEKPSISVESLNEAKRWLADNKKPNDVVLLENDLPDVNETKFAV